ncbi:MAG: hypothetical protein H7251_10360 [Acetobacteraceae bacterium]|nr:hypothetical protein [Acetobacteraceae bacterium]
MLHLSESGRRLSVDGDLLVDGERDEYAKIYRHFATLLQAGASTVDSVPLQLTADILLQGKTIHVGPIRLSKMA